MRPAVPGAAARALIAIAVFTSVGAARPAFAQDDAGQPAAAAPDAVELVDGSVVRGALVAVEPEVSVVMILSNGEQRMLPWASVHRVKRGGVVIAERDLPAPPPPPPPPPVAPHRVVRPPVDAGPSFGRPKIHIEANRDDVGLYVWRGWESVPGRPGARIAWGELVCNPPCDRVVDDTLGKQYVFGGEDLTMSELFTLSDRGGDQTVHVEAGSRGVRRGGFVLAVVGASSALACAIIAGTGVAKSEAAGQSQLQRDRARALAIGGGVCAGVSGAVLVGGIVMLSAGATTYTFERHPRATSLAPTLGAGATW